MKIGVCHANAHPPTAGIGNFAYNVAKSLEESGYEFHLFIRGGRTYERETDGNVVVHRCPYFKVYPFNNHVHRFFVDRRLQEMKAELDLLHLHSPISPPLKTDLPTVATIHTPIQHKQEIRPRNTFSDYLHLAQGFMGKRIERHIIEKSQVLTTVSESVRSDLTEYGLDEREIMVTPNGVDTAEFDPTRERARANQLLYTGRLAAVKGLPDLFDAIHQLNESGTSCRLVITGKGEYRAVLEEKAANLGIENQIEFVGFVSRDELVSLYETSDAFVFPTYYEGLPTSVLEAMAAGLPIVSTTAPGVRDLLNHEETGLLGAPGDVEALTQNIQRVVDDDALRSELGNRARQITETRYDWEIVSQTLKPIYEQVAK